jgi:hypothetical protein
MGLRSASNIRLLRNTISTIAATIPADSAEKKELTSPPTSKFSLRPEVLTQPIGSTAMVNRIYQGYFPGVAPSAKTTMLSRAIADNLKSAILWKTSSSFENVPVPGHGIDGKQFDEITAKLTGNMKLRPEILDYSRNIDFGAGRQLEINISQNDIIFDIYRDGYLAAKSVLKRNSDKDISLYYCGMKSGFRTRTEERLLQTMVWAMLENQELFHAIMGLS